VTAAIDPRLMRLERGLLERHFSPRQWQTVSSWAREHRVLSTESSSVAGRFRPKPYQVEAMDALDDPLVESVACIWPSQVGGKTEVGLNWFGRNAHLNPGPMLAIEPTLNMAKSLSEERFDPMFEHSPALRRLLAAAGTKGKGNRVRYKRGAGWVVTMIGARSAAELSMRPIRDRWFDEPDRYPVRVGEGEGEGSVIELGDARGATFPDGKRLLTGTPVYEDLANSIWVYHQSGSGGEWNVPCPHCGHEQELVFGDRDTPFGLKWDKGRPDTVQYLCAGCQALIPEHFKGSMNAKGRYVHARPEITTHRSFHFEAVASEQMSWPKLVHHLLETQGIPDKLQTFQNTKRALPWRESAVKVDTKELQQRRRVPEAEVPDWVEVLVFAVDVQHNRVEACAVGWGPGERCWMRNHRIEGDTSQITSAIWKDLDTLLATPLVRDNGKPIKSRLQVIDIGDQPEVVSEYVRTRRRLQVRAVRGVEVESMVEPVRRARKRNRFGIEYWQMSNLLTKRALFSRLARITRAGPGFIEFDAAVDDEMLKQFTAEKLVRQNGVRMWVRISGRPNEMIDLWRMGWVCLWILGGDLRSRLQKQTQPERESDSSANQPDAAITEAPLEPEPQARPRKSPRRGGGGFVKRLLG
jgi:phage terminase large subunit GpA-like protein